MANPIKDSLLYKTLFSQEMNFSGEEGAQRLHVLAMRIKKIEQCDRKELKADLDRILTDVDSPTLKPLQERGVCVLLLTDLGTYSKSDNFFDSLCCWICNTFGDRISSQSIIDTIHAIQAKDQTLLNKPLEERLSGIDEIVRELSSLQEMKISGQANGLFQQKVDTLNALKVFCEEQYTFISEGLDENSSFGSADCYNLAHQAKTVVGKLRDAGLSDGYEHLLQAIKRTADYKINSLAILDELNDADVAYLTSDEKYVSEKLTEFAKKDPKNAKAAFGDVVKLAHHVFLTKLGALRNCLTTDRHEEELKISRLQNDINVLGTRSRLLSAGRQLQVLDGQIRMEEREMRRETGNINELNSFIHLINKWTNGLGKLLNRQDRPDFLASMLKDYLDEQHNQGSARRFFKPHILFLHAVLSGNLATFNSGKLQLLHESLKSFENDSPDLKAEKERLRSCYAQDPQTLNEENKQLYVETYLECLKRECLHRITLCDNKKRDCAENIRTLRIQRQQTQRLELPNAPREPEPPAPSAVLPSPAIDQATGLKAQLLAWASQLEHNDTQLDTICTSLVSRPNVQAMVYQNFYFIMKKSRTIKADHDNWGGRVFFGYDLNTLLIDGTTQVELRAARARALRLAAEDKLITSETDVNLV